MGLIRDAVADYAEAVAISYVNVGSAEEGPVINEISGRRPIVQSTSSAGVWRHTAASHRTGSPSSARETWPEATWVISTNAAFFFFFLFLRERELFGKLPGEDYWKTQSQSFISGVFIACGVSFCNICVFAETNQLLVFNLCRPDEAPAVWTTERHQMAIWHVWQREPG